MVGLHEHWVGRDNGQGMYYFYDGQLGWAMYFSSATDSGTGIKNPKYCGDSDLEIGYRCKDGSYGFYPAKWAFTFWDLDAVVADFRSSGALPVWLHFDTDKVASDVFGRTSDES